MSDTTFNSMIDAKGGESVLSPWNLHIKLLAASAAVILAIFWRDAWEMVSTWWNISTYNHCLLIIPILYWLVQQRREELVKIRPQYWMPGLIWVGLASIAWLLGEAAGVSFARQLGLIMMLQGAVATILGPKVTRALIFPIFYSFFLVPFGEEFVPFLQTITAKMSMILLGWFDIPAFIDGVFISTPTGYFEVAEACSGVKFLIAMIAYGALVSNVCFQSLRRRTLFMAAAVIVPIIANGIRAFGTIYIAHHTSTDFASGFDHIFYGWFFFGFVLLLVMLIGWPFFDRKIDDPMIDADKINRGALVVESNFSWKQAAISLTVIVAAPVAWTSILAAQPSAVPEQIALPKVQGWERIDYQPLYEWKPRFDGANHYLLGRYKSLSSSKSVDVAVAVYDRQEEGREIVGYGQGAFDPQTEWSWTRDLDAPSGGSAMQITAPGPVVRNVLSFYQIGNKLTGSAAAVKLATLKTKLFGGSQQAVAILISAEKTGDSDQREAIDEFLVDVGPIDKLADEMAGLR